MARTKGEQTRARIEANALRLFASKGVEATSMRDLAAAVGVAEAALYRHFPSKEDLGRTVFLHHYAALSGKVSAIGAQAMPFREKVGALVAMFCRLFDEEPDVFAFILIHQHAHLRYVPEVASQNAVAGLAQIMAQAHASGEIAEADAELAAAMALGAVLQPAIFKLYGRLPGGLLARAGSLTRGALGAVGAV